MPKLIPSLALCILVTSAFAQDKIKMPRLTNKDFAERIEQGYEAVDSPEPSVTVVEREILEKVYSLIGTDINFAYSYLNDLLNSGTPISGAFNHALGNLYFKNSNYFQAEIQYLAAVGKHPTFQRAWNALGLARYKQGNYDEAAEALSNSVRFGANDSMTYGILGYCHLQLGRYRSAETAYHYAMLFDPEQTDWAEGLGQAYFETARFQEAISIFDDLIRTQPDNGEFWLLKANAWLALDEPLKTARCIEIARRFSEVDDDALYLLGNIYLEARIFDRAKEVFLAASSRSGELQERELLNAVRYLVFNDQHDFAEQILDLITEEGADWNSEDKTLFRFLTAEFAYFRDDLDSAERTYLTGIELDPFNGYALMKLAEINVRQGQTDQAIVYYDRAATNPSMRYNALVSKARALIDNKQYRFAMTTIEKALAEKSDARLNLLYAQVQRVVETSSN
ncbi:tetratricopeptide repeat protein [Pelagicoccus sp. SDUM812002]|uniref:tetratricopeptide repeat protein n=1 Tax=Pelagicoccus sp. SDUM812002 TaxID=3041266 RepID=UPI002810885E|nr:tetratricopeptide repeat protein [Pelagicoccus sp. SDUM812002]MDQ8184799.1 tetratricopeptide repeat protein [Pelagicoccus sp. SDUM812002]